jgi:hypothetical protein
MEWLKELLKKAGFDESKLDAVIVKDRNLLFLMIQ